MPNILGQLDEKIFESNVQDFIQFAKTYNIFQTGGTKFYHDTCDKIKKRCEQEGLSLETIRPE